MTVQLKLLVFVCCLLVLSIIQISISHLLQLPRRLLCYNIKLDFIMNLLLVRRERPCGVVAKAGLEYHSKQVQAQAFAIMFTFGKGMFTLGKGMNPLTVG